MSETLKIIWKAIQEPLREMILAVIPIILERLAVLNVWWAVVLYIALRALDQGLHELWKEKKIDRNGIVPLG